MKDVLKQAVETYNKIAKIYADYTYHKVQQYQLTKFSSMLPGKRILDVGSGSGRDVEYFLQEGYSALGIDISEGMLKEAKKRVTKKSVFKKMDFRKLKFKNESFDGIWSMLSLVHTPRKEIIKVLGGFNKVLVKRGVLFLALKEGEGEKEVKDSHYKNEPRTFVYFKEKEMRDYLEEAGFEIITSEINESENTKWLEIFARKL
jgi:ubiquinone/menaquinone biosynthesis C-methylase UbiE